MKRVIVIGSTGSGKTTLARELARLIGGVHIELDAFNFLPGWTDRPLDDMRALVADAVQAERWAACGNYGKIRDIVWPLADTAVWLDYPLPRILWRLTRRSITRAITREDLWNTGNRENFFQHLKWNKDSLYYWAITTRKRRTVQYEALFSSEPYDRIRLVRLPSVRDTQAWLQSVHAVYSGRSG
ncbi:MAG: adenylate kinase [Chloroflexi bacterium]|nr:adenylate kinase [Chloroflexota bacterium]